MNPFNKNTMRQLVRGLFLTFSVSGTVQVIVASEPAAVQWSTVRHVWGEDLSGSLQGAGGLLSTSFPPAQDAPSSISDLPSPARSAFMHEFICEMKLTDCGWGQFTGGETFNGDGSVWLPVQTRYALIWAAATAINDAKAKFYCWVAASQN